MAYKKNFLFRNIFNNFILRAQQSGLITKIIKDIEWEIIQKSRVRNVSKSINHVFRKIQFQIFLAKFNNCP